MTEFMGFPHHTGAVLHVWLCFLKKIGATVEICFRKTFQQRWIERGGRTVIASQPWNVRLARFLYRAMLIFQTTMCVQQRQQNSCVHSNLFYCLDNVDLAKRDAWLLCVSTGVSWNVPWATCLLRVFRTSGDTLSRRCRVNSCIIQR